MTGTNRRLIYPTALALVAGYLLFLGHLFTVSAHHATDHINDETTMEITVRPGFAGGFCSIDVTVSQGGQSQTETKRIYVPPFGEAEACFTFQMPSEEPVQYRVTWRSWQSSGEVTGP